MQPHHMNLYAHNFRLIQSHTSFAQTYHFNFNVYAIYSYHIDKMISNHIDGVDDDNDDGDNVKLMSEKVSINKILNMQTTDNWFENEIGLILEL